MKKKRRINRRPQRPAVSVIVINDRNATVASAELTQWIGGQLVTDYATGSAKREPDDVRDDVLATDLAVGRALVSLGRRLQGTARILVADAAHRQEHEGIRRVRNRLREQLGPRQPVSVHLPLQDIYDDYGLEAAVRAAERRGDEELLAAIVQAGPPRLPEHPGKHERPVP